MPQITQLEAEEAAKVLSLKMENDGLMKALEQVHDTAGLDEALNLSIIRKLTKYGPDKAELAYDQDQETVILHMNFISYDVQFKVYNIDECNQITRVVNVIKE